MDNFAFIIHPISFKADVVRKYPAFKVIPDRILRFMATLWPPVYISHITGIRSTATGKEIEGWFYACPLSPDQMLAMPVESVYRRIEATVNKAAAHGARIVGLGAYTSVVGDAGVTIASRVPVPVTTGDSYTVATALQATRYSAERLGIDVPGATAAVVGAYGAIGRASTLILARNVARVVLIGRDQARLAQVADLARAEGRAEVVTSTDIADMAQADMVLSVTSAVDTIIRAEHIKPGAVVCDVSRPRDVGAEVAEQRDDVLVIDGGMVAVPGDVDFHFNFGFPPRTAYACMAETMALAMAGRYESYTLGRDLTVSQVDEIRELAEYHGFRLGGVRSFEREVTDEHYARTLRGQAARGQVPAR
ncbi:MAG: shikimate dehydrogenase [Chloroflexi bacterium]|nr:shikimate dehydrogenase [Chloroflexota bacterium]MBU1746415.1 shikimate dehydrogenase [Chloroflexota bacterium]